MSDRIRSVQESALRQSLIEVVAEALYLLENRERPWSKAHKYDREILREDAAAVVDALRVEAANMSACLSDAVPEYVPLYRIGALEVG